MRSLKGAGGRTVLQTAALEKKLAATPEFVHSDRPVIDSVAAWCTVGIFIIIAGATIHLMASILMPVTLAVVVGIVLGQAADRLGKFGLPPMLGGFVLAMIFVFGLFWLVNALVTPMVTIAAEAPRLLEGLVARMQPMMDRYSWMKLAFGNMADEQALVDAGMQNVGSVLSIVANGLTPALVQTLVFLAALGLYLIGRLQLRHAIVMLLSGRKRRLACLRIMNATEAALGQYFALASLIYATLGVITMGIAFAGGLPMAPLWGLFAFVSSFIPFLGVAAMTIALVVGGLMTQDSLWFALFPAFGFFTLHLDRKSVV